MKDLPTKSTLGTWMTEICLTDGKKKKKNQSFTSLPLLTWFYILCSLELGLFEHLEGWKSTRPVSPQVGRTLSCNLDQFSA